MEKEDVPSSSRKRKCKDKKPNGEENSERLKSPTTSLNKAPSSMNSPVYEIGPPSWLKREINAYILSAQLNVPGNFCKAIGLCRTSEIVLRTTADEDHGPRTWQVRFLLYKYCNSGMLTRGWKRFCADNRTKEGDICTFNIIKTTLWHVEIMRHG
ncbi:putative B3 domain-containing protein [Panicum miliaceum]|uniref:B3 domain-containing protein n=1 Tax=Panicum miliaceum TaxID=4540 RepID=A0A3L6QA33_PANMI|nr:putative B3 domain-containing protein [Panicum miliaceum]